MTLIKQEYAIKEIESAMETSESIILNAGLACAKGIIASLPSAEDKWIPCSERLPNDAKDVLVCMRNEWIYIASYRHSQRLWKFETDGYANCEIVLAWMPLPKPYREGGE